METRKIAIRNSFCLVITGLLFMQLFVNKAQARFDYKHEGVKGWVASTKVLSEDGLGEVLRQLGVQPNWTDKSWIDGIALANPGMVDKKGHIVKRGKTLHIPISYLQKCKGYDQLTYKLGLPSKPVVKAKPAIPIQQKPIVKAPPPVERPGAIEDIAMEPSTPIRYSMELWGGAGLGQLSGKDSNSNETDLSSDLFAAFGARFLIHWSDFTDIILYARGSSLSFSPIDTITFMQESDLLFTYGGELNFRWGEGFRWGIFGESRSVNRADFNITSLDIRAAAVTVAGLSLRFRVFNWAEQGLFLELRPYTMLSATAGTLDVESGFGVQTRVNIAPSESVDAAGWMYGVEHIYEAQKAVSTGSSNNASEQTANKFFVYFGYRI